MSSCKCQGGECDEPRDTPRQVDRREFLRLAGATAAINVGLHHLPVMAGPFDNDYLRVIPQDKRLDPRWVRSLYERDEPDVYRGWEELRDIGMPVGGLAGERDRLIDSSKLGT